MDKVIHNGIAYVDNTLLGDVAKCSTKTVLRHVFGMTTPEESAVLKAGTACHESLAVFFKGGTVKEAIRALRKHYRTWAEENIDPDDKYLARLCWENVKKTMRYWMEQHPMSSMPFTVLPEHVEVGLAYPLTKDGSIVLCGRLDAGPVKDNQSGNYYVLDHKTTGFISPAWLKQFRLSSQISGYLWMTEQHSPVTVVGAYVNAIQLSKLPGLDDLTRKCRDPEHGGVTYEECQHLHVKSEFAMTQRSPAQVKTWKRTAVRLAKKYVALAEEAMTTVRSRAEIKEGMTVTAKEREKIHTVPMEGMFHQACTYCEFHDFCHTGRKNWQMLTHDPWEPYDVAKGGAK